MTTEEWLTQHASPRWVASKIYIDNIPDDQRDAYVEELAFAYPTWFFEIFTEFKGQPLTLEDFQIRYLLDKSTFTITNKTRQSGGSMQLAMSKLYKAYRTPGYRCDIVSINLKEATDKIRYIRNFWETLPDRYRVPLTVDNALSIGFHKGRKQSVIHSVAASAGVRGGSKEVVFDEFAHIMKADDLYIGAAPAIINGDLSLDIVSTPRGNLNKFAEIWHNEPNEEGIRPYSMFSRHKFIWLDVRRFVTDFDKAQNAWHNELREDMSRMKEMVHAFGTERLKFFYYQFPWDIFLQEFCGVFLDETTAFFTQALIERCTRPPFSKEAKKAGAEEVETLDPWTSRPKGNVNQVFMGVDFGESDRETDKTSIQILEKDGTILKHRYSEVLSKDKFPDFPAQAAHIGRVARDMHVQKVVCDETGLGRGLVPLVRKELPDTNVEGVNFNFASKEEMVMNLKTLMEQNNLWLLQEDRALQGQIRNIQRDLNPNGTHRYHGEPHDDMFWALCMAAKGGSYKPFSLIALGGSRRGGF